LPSPGYGSAGPGRTILTTEANDLVLGLTHPSQPNYLFLFSGANQGVTSDATPPTTFSTPNLGAALRARGLRFASFSESLPFAGFTGDSAGAYVRRHAPWVNWQGTGRNRLPAQVNLPFTAFPHNFQKLPTVSFVIPNLLNDMHDGTVAEGTPGCSSNSAPTSGGPRRTTVCSSSRPTKTIIGKTTRLPPCLWAPG
jgi:hypothetical protein